LSAMKATVLRPQDLGPTELAAWDAMRRAQPELASPFLTPAFALATGRFHAAARVAVLEEGDEVVGFFPFDQGPFRTARPIAAGVSDTQGIIQAAGRLGWNPLELLKCCRLNVWEFDHLVAGQIPCAGGDLIRHSSPVIDVSAGYEEYVAERQRVSKKVIKSTLYKLRKLGRDIGPTRFEFDSQAPEVLSRLIAWKSAQYRRTGRRDRFATRWINSLVRELFASRSNGCSGVLSVLHAGDRMVAAHLGLRSERSLSCWFPAYDPELARYSPGLALHLKMAEAAAEAGIHQLDLGKGDEPYKQSLKTGDLTVGEGWIRRPSLGAVVHGARRAPSRSLSKVILSHPRLRRATRSALRQVGNLRSPT
jgi:CelD/BcsL family acetyltransferase involved in cellulose biosynthesis